MYASRLASRGANMCDEYYDERMKAFWRALEQVDQEREVGVDEVEPIELPKVVPLENESARAKPKLLTR